MGSLYDVVIKGYYQHEGTRYLNSVTVPVASNDFSDVVEKATTYAGTTLKDFQLEEVVAVTLTKKHIAI